MTTSLEPAPATLREVDLAVSGMTCASCVARVERKLGKIPGVEAVVNLPLESAHVVLTQQVDDADLLAAVESAGYSARVTGTHVPSSGPSGAGDGAGAGEDDARDGLRTRLLVAAALTVPVLVLSMVPGIELPGQEWIVAALALPVVTWAAWPFHAAAARAARHGTSTMDTLVSIGVTAATLWSLWSVVRGDTMGMYFEVGAVVTTFLLAGRYAEHRSRRRAGDALRSLLELGAKDAERVAVAADGTPVRRPDGAWSTTSVPVSELHVGDVFVVRPGSTVATDGEVLEGTSAVDTSLVTGEPVPVDVAPGDTVVGGTINTSGHLLVRATRVGAQTTLARIGALVTQAQTGKAPVARLADRISAVFVPVVLVIAAGTLVAWLLAGAGSDAAFTAAVAVLIIACPCALGLATPTAILVGTGRGAQLGILIRGPEILERTRAVDTVVLDKTGTVTEGRMALERVVPAAGEDADEALRYAAAVEALSEHPVARAVAAAAQVGAAGDEAVELGADGVAKGSLQVSAFVATPGGGVEGVVRRSHDGLGSGLGLNARRVAVGRLAWLGERGVTVPTTVSDAVAKAEDTGATTVVVAWDGTARAVLELRDPVKATSAEAVAELRDLGLRPVLLTGDGEGAAREAARAVGIAESDVVARVLPDAKAAAVGRLQQAGRTVAMVGDGVNDAAALATADLGLAMGTGTDVAIEASDITLVRGDLRSAATAVRLSRTTLRVIKQNLFWAFAYNVAAIPLAAAGLLNPMIAGAAMAASSVLVVANSLRLRRIA